MSYGIFGLIDAIEKFDPSGLQVRDLRHQPHQGLDPRRAALDRLLRLVRAKARSLEKPTPSSGDLHRTPPTPSWPRELDMSEGQLSSCSRRISCSCGHWASTDAGLAATRKGSPSATPSPRPVAAPSRLRGRRDPPASPRPSTACPSAAPGAHALLLRGAHLAEIGEVCGSPRAGSARSTKAVLQLRSVAAAAGANLMRPTPSRRERSRRRDLGL